MASVNFAIERVERLGGVSRRFLWAEAGPLDRICNVMPAALDLDSEGEFFRVEILYLWSEMTKHNLDFRTARPFRDAAFFMQVGTDNPVTLIIEYEKMYEEAVSCLNDDAYLLADEAGNACGVEVIVQN